MRAALVLVVLLATAGVAGGASHLPLVSTNGVSVYATCRTGDLHRRTADGAELEVSLSRLGCVAQAASIVLRGAPSGAWLWIGTTDIYQVGLLRLSCRGGIVSSTFSIDPHSATASVTVESTAFRTEKTLQPGQRLRLPSIRASRRWPDRSVAWNVGLGGEAGWTDAHFVEVAEPHCRADVRVLVTAFRNG